MIRAIEYRQSMHADKGRAYSAQLITTTTKVSDQVVTRAAMVVKGTKQTQDKHHSIHDSMSVY